MFATSQIPSAEIEYITFDKSLVGLIAGKRGENFMRVEAKPRCRVKVCPALGKTGYKRLCWIKYTSSTKAKAEIYQIIYNVGAGVPRTLSLVLRIKSYLLI
jgi:hypothetical protein